MYKVNAENIYKEIISLPIQEKMILFSKLFNEILFYVDREKKLDFYDIRGIGKEIWEDEDAQKYVNKERDSWD